MAPSVPDGYTLLRTGDVHDFDFLAGQWRVAGRRLEARGVGCTDWVDCPGTSIATLYLGGIANVDQMTFPSLGWSGMTIRSFCIADRQWSIRWISSRSGVLEPPVVGGFDGDRGEFYGEDTEGGQSVQVRFLWTRRGRDGARWEQAFSHDRHSWETNWVMELTRMR